MTIIATIDQLSSICHGRFDTFDGHRHESRADMERFTGYTGPDDIQATVGELRAVWPKQGRSLLYRLVDGAWQPEAPPPTPFDASADCVAERLATCRACPSFDGKVCTVAGCGCSGAGFLERALSKCPVGKWGPQLRQMPSRQV